MSNNFSGGKRGRASELESNQPETKTPAITIRQGFDGAEEPTRGRHDEATSPQGDDKHGELHTNTTPAGEEAPSISSELLDETTFADSPIILSDDSIDDMGLMELRKSIFVNRTSELGNLFKINAKCNLLSSLAEEQVQHYAVPVAAMTYGAGKTALGSNYLSEMRKWAKGDNLDEDQQTALQCLKEQGHHDQLQALCADDTVSVRINSDISLEENLGSIFNQLIESLPPDTWKPSPGVSISARVALKSLIPFIRKTRAVFIMVDEINKMRGDDDINDLREFFVDIHVANARSQDPTQAKPFHFYVCGKVDRGVAVYMAKSLSSSSPYTWHSLVLEPLQPKHVCRIRERLGLSFSTSQGVDANADAKISELTAGVPRQIWRVLTAAKILGLQFHSTEHAATRLAELCSVLSRHPLLQGELVNLVDKSLLEEYINMHIMSVTRSLIPYPICSRYLPITLTAASEGRYRVNTAPIFTVGLSSTIIRHLNSLKEVEALNWIPSGSQANEAEILVMQTLYRPIILHGVAKNLTDTVPALKLHQLLPFLKDSEKVQDQELPDTPLDQMARQVKKSRRNSSPVERFAKLQEARNKEPSAPNRAGVVFRVGKGTSAADVIVDFPLVSKGPAIRVVEIQVKATTLQKNAVSVSTLHNDCCEKATISSDPNELTLHILSAQMLKGALLKKIPKSGVLVLSPGEPLEYSRAQNPEEKEDTKRRTAAQPEQVQEQALKAKVDVTFEIPQQLYVVVLSPDANKEWLQNTL